MNIQITGHNTEISDAEYDRVDEHLERLQRYLKKIDAVQINVTKERHMYKVEIHLSSRNLKLYGTAATPKILVSIDKAMDRIIEQCHRYKKKLQATRTRPDYSQIPDAEVGLSTLDYPAEVEKKPTVVKTERHIAKPMVLEEAIMQMDLLNTDFFVFTDAKSRRVCVLYHRKDKQLGLIET